MIRFRRDRNPGADGAALAARRAQCGFGPALTQHGLRQQLFQQLVFLFEFAHPLRKRIGQRPSGTRRIA